MDTDSMNIDQQLADICENRITVDPVTTRISHIANTPHLSQKQQFILLSTISNYHWADLPSIENPHKMIKGGSSRFVSHFMSWQGTEENRKYLPGSPRNRIMYFIIEDYSSSLYNLVKHLVNKDNGAIEEHPEIHQIDHENQDLQDAQLPPRKKKRISPRTVAVAPSAISKAAGVDLNELLNSAQQNRTLYTKFKEQLITEGVIKWRSHEERKDIAVLSDINTLTGNIVPNSFVHVTSVKDFSGEQIITCTCSIYKMIQRAAHQENPIFPQEEILPDASFTCIHCRYFKEKLLNAYNEASNVQCTNLPKPIEMVRDSLHIIGKEVFLLGDILPNGTTKFSVKGEENYSIVNFTFNHGRCSVKCTNGLCQVQMNSKKKIPKHGELSDKTDNLCTHLQSLKSNLVHVKELFPEYFSTEYDIDEAAGPMPEDVNTDDINITSKSGNFNIETGLWDYPSFSDHKPMEMNDIQLVKSTKMRNAATVNDDQMFSLKPSCHASDGNLKRCPCGEVYAEEQLAGVATLYTRIGAIQCTYYNIICNSGSCKLEFHEAAAENGIFFSTKVTAAGDEIGWDFVSSVMRTKTSFTAFCTEMTRKYSTNSINAPHFMSPNTFVKWFFGWLAHMKIDFRKEIDPWCGHDPEYLACDGTHIGVNIKHMQLDRPVIFPDKDGEPLQSLHRRKDRNIIPEDQSRIHLRYICDKFLNKLKPHKILPQHIEDFNKQHLMQVLQNLNEPRLYNFINIFVQKGLPDGMLKWMGRLLHMLSGDAALSSVLPFAGYEIFVTAASGNFDESLLTNMKEYNYEIAQLLILSEGDNSRSIITDFIEYMLEKLDAIHSVNRKPAPHAQEIPGTYNPPSGVAYYFTPTGEQVRKMPEYQVGASGKMNYDDIPVVHDPCTKNYPGVSTAGFGYMFLWFCPIHGHCYGFHLIAGGEGRRDPFSSLFKYKKTMPKELFYDFACQLSEYALNREPELFKNTRFWHDLFHALGHLCGWNFKSGRVVGLDSINTEICEQVNSFLQCIKYTGSHLSQEHFVFFVQFFLYILNKNKTKSFQQQATIAFACQL